MPYGFFQKSGNFRIIILFQGMPEAFGIIPVNIFLV